MPQLGQWLWACPFLWLMGESFFALRLSTIALSWLGLAAFYDLLRQQEVPTDRAALAVTALAFNPLFFLLSGTFMTDVPALALSLAALALYGRALQGDGRVGWLLAAGLVATLATLTRQNTVAVSVVAAVLLARQRSLRVRPAWWLAVALPVVAGLVAHLWFQQRTDIIPVEVRPLAPPKMLQLPYVAIHWCGLAILPLLPLAPRCGWRRTFTVLFVLLAANAGYWLYHLHSTGGIDGLFPYTGTILNPWGGGPGDLNPGERPVVLSWGLRWVLTFAGCVGGAWLLARAAEWKERPTPLGPLLLFTLLQLPFLAIAPAVWDRYLLALLPGALFLAVLGPVAEGQRGPAAFPRWPALAALVVCAAVSITLMHDWLAWNAASWELGRRAVARGIDPRAIEGGLEWDGWYDALVELPQRRSWRDLFMNLEARAGGPKGLTLPTTRVWFPQIRGDYSLSFSPLAGAAMVDWEPYHLWLAPGEHRFYLLRAAAAEASRERRPPSR